MSGQQHFHIVGVAGSGMSAVAQLLLAQGHCVSGSDRFSDKGSDLLILSKLRAGGLRLVPQDGSGIIGPACTVVVSSAIEGDNPDILAAKKTRAAIVPRAEMLARMVEGRECVAVAGTSGKSTVTGMTGWILDQLGADPTVVNGGAVLNWLDDRRIGNVRIGGSGPWVIETDESDRSLLKFKPDWAIVTNIAKDHFDLDSTKELFAQFAGQVRKGIIGPDVSAADVSIREELFSGTVFDHGGTSYRVNLPGRHNVANALQAAALCERLGYPAQAVSDALATFTGIERRMQVLGSINGAVVVDDFAHNPSKIKASLQTTVAHFSRVVAVWRPHGFRPLEFMQDELLDVLAGVLRPADEFLLLPVFYAGGTVERKITSDLFAEKLSARGVCAIVLADHEACIDYLAGRVGPGEAVLIMGARDPALPQLGRKLVAAG